MIIFNVQKWWPPFSLWRNVNLMPNNIWSKWNVSISHGGFAVCYPRRRHHVQPHKYLPQCKGLHGGMWFSFHRRELFHPFNLPPHPKLLFCFLPSHLATHHCPTKRWQLVTNGLHCTLRVSCPRRQWQTQGSEEVQRRKGAGSPRSSRAPGTGGWKSIQIRPLIGHDSTKAVECGNPLSTTHSRFGWWREREQRRAKGRGRGKETLFHIIATRAVPFKTYSFQTVSCSMSEWLKSLAAGRMGYVSKIHNWFGMTAFQWCISMKWFSSISLELQSR